MTSSVSVRIPQGCLHEIAKLSMPTLTHTTCLVGVVVADIHTSAATIPSAEMPVLPRGIRTLVVGGIDTLTSLIHILIALV